jgi:general L-amino acid transport system ATP-binding protein
MICVTHEMGFARRVASRCVFMDHGEIIEIAVAKEFFAAPRSERLRAFLSQILN